MPGAVTRNTRGCSGSGGGGASVYRPATLKKAGWKSWALRGQRGKEMAGCHWPTQMAWGLAADQSHSNVQSAHGCRGERAYWSGAVATTSDDYAIAARSSNTFYRPARRQQSAKLDSLVRTFLADPCVSVPACVCVSVCVCVCVLTWLNSAIRSCSSPVQILCTVRFSVDARHWCQLSKTRCLSVC